VLFVWQNSLWTVTEQAGRTGRFASRPNVSTRSETNWPRIGRRFGDRPLALDLRSEATRRWSSLAPSTAVTSDSWSFCVSLLVSTRRLAQPCTCAVCLVHSSGRVLPNNALTNTQETNLRNSVKAVTRTFSGKTGAKWRFLSTSSFQAEDVSGRWTTRPPHVHVTAS